MKLQHHRRTQSISPRPHVSHIGLIRFHTLPSRQEEPGNNKRHHMQMKNNEKNHTTTHTGKAPHQIVKPSRITQMHFHMNHHSDPKNTKGLKRTPTPRARYATMQGGWALVPSTKTARSTSAPSPALTASRQPRKAPHEGKANRYPHSNRFPPVGTPS